MANRIFTSVRSVFARFWHWRWRNYLLVLVVFAAWALFLSPNTISTQIKVRRDNRELKKLRNFYRQEIEHNEAQIEKFKTDPEFVEAYGRETYLMKADNEDIYLFVE